MKLHPSLTPKRLIEAVERGITTLDNPGFCIACGAEAESCEPDAQKYECEHCGKRAVYGAEFLAMSVRS
jgi:hypothetical protein